VRVAGTEVKFDILTKKKIAGRGLAQGMQCRDTQPSLGITGLRNNDPPKVCITFKGSSCCLGLLSESFSMIAATDFN
jgi:hypothetical protein